MKDTTKVRKSKEGINVFENADFAISIIPLNYMITYKVKAPYKTKKLATERLLIGQRQYSDLDRGLEYAKETAQYMIDKARKQLA